MQHTIRHVAKAHPGVPLLALAATFATFTFTAVAVLSVPRFSALLGVSPGKVGLVLLVMIGTVIYSQATLAPKLIRWYKPNRILATAAAICAVFCYLALAAEVPGVGLLAVVVFGASHGVFMAVTTFVFSSAGSPGERGTVQGLLMGANGLGKALAPLAMGLLFDTDYAFPGYVGTLLCALNALFGSMVAYAPHKNPAVAAALDAGGDLEMADASPPSPAPCPAAVVTVTANGDGMRGEAQATPTVATDAIMNQA
jgi:predicted MFS family arabinose efflux permease